jgi:co-chaperonin GroES (HSP10)
MPGVVLVEPIKDDSIIQSTGRDYTNAAVIIALNPLNETLTGAKVGDIIFYDEYAYRRFEHEGKDIFAVDTRGDGVWIIGKTDQNEQRSEGELVQEEGIPAPVSSSETTG